MGVIGDPIAHSLSPDMHNAAIDALGIDCCYVAWHVLPERVAEAVAGVRGLDILGLNVTIPHKLAVMEHVDRISEEALAVGAVNTIHNEDGELTGYNTDVFGVLMSLERVAGFVSLPAQCVVLGAGGAARAVTYALASRDEVERVTLLNRTTEKAEALALDMEKITGKSILPGGMEAAEQQSALVDAGLVVNTTSLGMHPQVEGSPLAEGIEIHPELVLYDTVYNPLRTTMMVQFESAGARAFGGLDMLVYQGARSFELWTGTFPPTDVMKQALIGRFS
ncbi:MAG: shikimate dehydrogenase [Gemmatimonadetes bacterium]|nr:shikimate dehydrogenase [Gemmatimonadota bacterium]|tara:strand:+ start:1387 stop:2223 length:837 start_codon:yes stop_codon:yes gene_type:complete